MPVAPAPHATPSSTGKPFYKRARTWGIVAGLLLIVFLWLSEDWKPEPPPVDMGKPNPAVLWLTQNYPTLISPKEKQQYYQTLIRGYFVPQTGLYLSFPGTGDLALVQQAATYDQGIVGVLLLALGDIRNAGAIVRFYEKAWELSKNRSGPRKGKGGLSNFYNAYFGVEGIEKTIHVGPNAWIGLLASRYHAETGDTKALHLALEITRWMIYKVPHTNGAIAMGEMAWNATPWDKIYSTENNESTYAFLVDMLRHGALPARDRQAIEMESHRIKRWLIEKGYDPKSRKVIRGFHPGGIDHVGAIDSYTWFIGALRPSVVRANDIPVDHLMNFATQEFTVQVGRRWGIDPVDSGMAKATFEKDTYELQITDPLFLRPNKARNPVIWLEGTGQYIVALQDAAVEFVHHAFKLPEGPERAAALTQAKTWLSLAKQGVGWMDDAKVETRWGTTFSCATEGRFYLHGWPAPRGTAERDSDAVAALVWRLFAGIGFEPLSGTYMHPTFPAKVATQNKTRHDPGTDLLYGASEEMVVRAWNLYEEKNFSLAQRQAQATIELWEKDAKALQKKKQDTVGNYLDFDGQDMNQLQRVHDFWALNDVCAAYFIQGRMAHERQDYTQALRIFTYILKEFPLAQMWDKRGWFWDPVNTLQMEFAAGDPERYGSLYDLIPQAR